MWNILDRGFLPSSNPLNTLPITDIRNTELVYTWENFSATLPHYLNEECFREEIIYSLRIVSNSYYHGFMDNLGGQTSYERAFLLLAYFATAYINSPEGKKKAKLPKEITVPFARVAHLVGRQPVLDYTSYILYNWQHKNSQFSDSDAICTFTDSTQEKLIISTLVEMEYRFSTIIKDFADPQQVINGLCKVNEFLQTLHSKLDANFLEYYEIILSDYKNLKYEQWRQDELSFPCDIFLQSPALFTMYKYLDIDFQNDYLRRRNSEILNFHMPIAHKTFINSVNGIKNKFEKEIYNNCLRQLIDLRNNLLFRSSDREMAEAVNEELVKHFQ